MGKPTPLAIVICVFLAAVSSSLDQPEDVNEALKASSQSVVTLSCLDSHKKEIHRGKGVVVSAEGLVLTNYHILSGAHSAKALIVKDEIRQKVDWEDVFYPGYERAEAAAKKKKLRGRWVKVAGIVAVDRNLNLAVVRIEGKGYRPAPLSPSDRMEIGDRVFIVAEEESLAEGSIIGTAEVQGTRKIARLSLSIPPEMTGSPLFNEQGEVTGIVTYLAESSNTLFPAAYAAPLVRDEKETALSKFGSEDFSASPEGLYLKSVATAMAGDIQQALAFIEKSLEKNPRNPFALSQKGFLLETLNAHERAVEAYSRALDLNPRDFRAALGLGKIHLKQNRFRQAIPPLLRCTELRPDLPDAFYHLGLAYEKAGDLEKAAQAYQRFIQINPGPAWTGLNQLGGVYIKMGRYGEAIQAFDKVLNTNPSDLKALYNLAYACDMSGEFDRAASLYRKLITLNPKDARAYRNLLFRMFDRAGRFREAARVAEEVVSADPSNPQDHYNLGIIYYKMAAYEKALASFRQALDLNPGFAQAHYNIGLVHFKNKNYGEALTAFLSFDKLQPDNPDALYNIGVACLQLKRYEEALTPLQRVIALKPDYALAHYNLAIAYYVLGDKYSAHAELQRLNELDRTLAEKLRKIIRK